MLKEIRGFVKKPKLFAKSEAKFWNDEYMSKGFLEAHLSPDIDAASRKHSTIEESVVWINNSIVEISKILDLGCGPGLYSNALAERGHELVGIDLSKRSLSYAREVASQKCLDVSYIEQNYLEIDYHEEFDVILLIYCDLGALVNDDRDILLEKIYKALKPGGLFIFDVHSFSYSSEVKSSFSYELESKGFFIPEEHLELKQTFYYEEMQAYLDQYTIITDKGITQHRVYKQLYDRAKIREITMDYASRSIYSDITGKEFCKDSDTIAVIARK